MTGEHSVHWMHARRPEHPRIAQLRSLLDRPREHETVLELALERGLLLQRGADWAEYADAFTLSEREQALWLAVFEGHSIPGAFAEVAQASLERALDGARS